MPPAFRAVRTRSASLLVEARSAFPELRPNRHRSSPLTVVDIFALIPRGGRDRQNGHGEKPGQMSTCTQSVETKLLCLKDLQRIQCIKTCTQSVEQNRSPAMCYRNSVISSA